MWEDLSLNSAATVWLNNTASSTWWSLFFFPHSALMLITANYCWKRQLAQEAPLLLSFVSYFLQIVFFFPSWLPFMKTYFILSLSLHFYSGHFAFFWPNKAPFPDLVMSSLHRAVVCICLGNIVIRLQLGSNKNNNQKKPQQKQINSYHYNLYYIINWAFKTSSTKFMLTCWKVITNKLVLNTKKLVFSRNQSINCLFSLVNWF